MKPHLEEYIERKVASGEFQSRDEVIEAALRFYRDLEEEDEEDRAWREFQRARKDSERCTPTT